MSSKTRHSRWLLVAALMLLAPALLAVARISPAAAQDDKLTLWFDTTGGAETAECIIANAIDPFNGQDGVQIEATLQPNNWDATRTALAGGAGPDIVVTPGPSFVFELANAGQLLSLDQFAAQMGWTESFVPWALDLGKVNGQLYSLPTEVETLVLYYNKTLFEEQGWTPPKTYDELMAVAQTAADADIIPFAHVNKEWRPANEWFVGEFLNHGAGGPTKVYEALSGTTPWTDQSFVDSLNLLNQMQQNGWFMGGLDRYYTGTFDDASAALAAGEAAMKIEGTWFQSDAQVFFEESGQEWGWVPVPSADGAAYFDLGIGSTYSINAKSANPEGAANFINYYFSPEMQAKLAVTCGLAPAPVTISPDQLTGLDVRYGEILTALNTASTENNYGYTTWTFFPPKTETYLIEEIEKVWAGDITVEEYLQGLQTQFDQEKAAGEIPPMPAR
jgi:raffinose/stachyose/melibiose transport system substrate-binding protein